MDYLILKNSLYEGLVFQKPTVSSVKELVERDTLNRTWFAENYPIQSKNSPCNFTTLGGLLQHFNLATYIKGEYKRK